MLCSAGTLHGIRGGDGDGGGADSGGTLLLLDCISAEAPLSVAPPAEPLPDWAKELNDVERAVLAGDGSRVGADRPGVAGANTVLSDGERCWLADPNAPISLQQLHPSAVGVTLRRRRLAGVEES